MMGLGGFGTRGRTNGVMQGILDPSALRQIAGAVLGDPTSGFQKLLDPGLLRGPDGQALADVIARGGPTSVVIPPPRADAPELYAEIESRMMLNPAGLLARYFPVHYLGATIAAGVMTAAPQRRCIPLRMHVPRAQAAGTVQSLTVALQPIHYNATAESAGMYAEDTFDSAWLPPIVCGVGQAITATVTGVTSAGFFVAELERGIVPPSSFLARAMGTATIAAATPGQVSVAPQKKMRLRRILVDLPTAATALATVTNVLCGVDPQFDSGSGIPLSMFDDRMALGFVDGDIVVPGQNFFINLTNNDVAPHTYNVTILGDAIPES